MPKLTDEMKTHVQDQVAAYCQNMETYKTFAEFFGNVLSLFMKKR